MHITYRVELTADERAYLELFTSQGKQRVRALKRAQVVIAGGRTGDDGPGDYDGVIGEHLDGVPG